MFLHLSIILFTGGGLHPSEQTPPSGQTRRHPLDRHTPWADSPLGKHPHLPRWPPQWTVRILLECILVHICFHTSSPFEMCTHNIHFVDIYLCLNEYKPVECIHYDYSIWNRWWCLELLGWMCVHCMSCIFIHNVLINNNPLVNNW